MSVRTIKVTEDNKIIFGGEETGLQFPRAAVEDAVKYHGRNIWPHVINAILKELDGKYNLTNDERLLGRLALAEVA